jgi:hypothetical protein
VLVNRFGETGSFDGVDWQQDPIGGGGGAYPSLAFDAARGVLVLACGSSTWHGIYEVQNGAWTLRASFTPLGEGAAIGFVGSRLFEAAVLMIGTVSILSIVTLQQPGATGPEASVLVTLQQALVAVRDWSFALGTGVPALNAALLGYLMYRSRLVPRAIPVLGLIGAPLFASWVVGYILGISDGGSAWHAIAVAPIFFWELSIGLWMAFKGFRKDAPLMIEAAESDRLDSGTASGPSIGIAPAAGPA